MNCYIYIKHKHKVNSEYFKHYLKSLLVLCFKSIIVNNLFYKILSMIIWTYS